MSVIDSSAAFEFLLDERGADEVAEQIAAGRASAPDLFVFEVVSAVGRAVARGAAEVERAGWAVRDLADLRIELFPSLPLRQRAWELRENLSTADAFFVALAELLDEPLVTLDRRMAAAARDQAGIKTVLVGG